MLYLTNKSPVTENGMGTASSPVTLRATGDEATPLPFSPAPPQLGKVTSAPVLHTLGLNGEFCHRGNNLPSKRL